MKKRILKLLSAVLILSFLVSVFSVLAVADTASAAGTGTTQAGEKNDSFEVFFNRSFEDGWDHANGFSSASLGENNISIDYEEDALGKYNYFIRYEALTANAGSTSLAFEGKTVATGTRDDVRCTVVEFSIKADDLAYLGKIMNMGTGIASNSVNMLEINSNGDLIVFSGREGGKVNLGKLQNEWINLAFVFDWMEDDYVCYLHYGYGYNQGYQKTEKLVMAYDVTGDLGMKSVTFTIPSTRSAATIEESYGMSYCIDNLKIYHGTTGIVELEPTNYGTKVDNIAEKVIPIRESADQKTNAEILEAALAMKLGVDYALANNVRYPLKDNYDAEVYNNVYGAPVKQGENILVPLQLILDFIGLPSYTHTDGQSFDITTGTSKTYMTVGRSSATVDGTRVELAVAPGYLKNSDGKDYLVIALSDVEALFPGWLTIYDDMGLVIVYEDLTPDNTEDNEPLVTREKDLEAMIGVMKKFVFDITTESRADQTYITNGTNVFTSVNTKTNGFAHPYIIANADTFASLKSLYNLNEGDTGYNAEIKAHIQTILDKAESYYNENAMSSVSGGYQQIKADKIPIAPTTSDGYDAYGKLNSIEEYTENLPVLAFAYQITGNEKYARFVYDWVVALGKWNHWGPSYMENCSQAAASVAISYDWLYNAYKDLSLNTDTIASIIYNLGVHDGYVSSKGNACEHPRALGDMSVYATSKDSVNAISSSSMVIAALSILDYVSADEISSKDANAYDETIYLIGNNIYNLVEYGLNIYAPDGSYIESPIHWEKATSAFFRMTMALVSSTGSDYGFMNTWGIKETCYYACHIESSEGFIWNYHDGGPDGFTSGERHVLNTDMFNFVGTYLGDATLLMARKNQIENGKPVSIYDLFFYPIDGIEGAGELELDYVMSGIEGFVTRSDWNDGALYTGLMGGSNSAANSQLDSGNFIYYNKGIAWVIDLGSENTNVATYTALDTRYKHYRASSEGQNVVSLLNNSALLYGQYAGNGGVIVSTGSNEYGSYSTIDNTSVYSGKVAYASRGVLLTNNRSTVVLQDELSFSVLEDFAWTLHTTAEITLSSNGRTAYLKNKAPDGKTYTLRASIVSQRPDFVFTVREATENLNSNTYPKGNAVDEGTEYSREGIHKLVIEGTLVSFDCAVVFDIINNDIDEAPPVQYQWTSMKFWEPVESTNVETTTSSDRGVAVKTDIRTSTVSAELILDGDDPFTVNLVDLYKALTLVEYTLKSFKPETLTSTYATAYEDYIDLKEDYEKFFEYANGNVEIAGNITNLLLGISDMYEAEEE